MRNRLLIIISLFCLCSMYCLGQVSFQKAIGSNIGYDQGYSVKQTSDGGYLVSGYAWTVVPSSFIASYLIKTDSQGDLLWKKVIGTSTGYMTYGMDARETADGGYILTGYWWAGSSAGSSGGFLFLVKTNNTGDTIWKKCYGGIEDNMGSSVFQTPDNGYIVAGSTSSFGAGNTDDFLLKTDSEGNVIWSKCYGGALEDKALALVPTSDQGYILAGITKSFNSNLSDIYVVKTSATGDTLWTRKYGGNYEDYGSSVVQCIDGGYAIAGSTKSFGAGGSDVYVIKTNGNGNVEWSKAYGSSGTDIGYCIRNTQDHGFIITGQSDSLGGEILIKTDSLGTIQWSKAVANAKGLAVELTNDGGYIVTGEFTKLSGDADVLLLKTNNMGNSGCNETTPNIITMNPPTQQVYPNTQVSSVVTPIWNFYIFVESTGNDTTLCTEVGLPEAEINQEFRVFPNPASGKFSISYPCFSNKGELIIYNSLGSEIKRETVHFASRKEINPGDLSPGIYYIKFSDGNKQFCRKLVMLRN